MGTKPAGPSYQTTLLQICCKSKLAKVNSFPLEFFKLRRKSFFLLVSFYLGADHLTCGGGGSGGGGGMGDLFKNIILQTVFEGKKSCKEIPGEKNILP